LRDRETPLLAEKAQLAADRTRSFARTPYASIVAVYVALRVIAAIGIPAMRHPDSESWLRVNFAGSEIRLWTVPLFFKALPNDALRVAGQVTLSTVCWVAVAGVAAWVIANRKLALIAFAALLVVSLAPDVTAWDVTILGESVAISITVASIAAWWAFVVRPTWTKTALVSALIVLWAFLRHTNVVITMLIAVILAGTLLIRHGRRFRAVILAVCIVTLVWGMPTFGKNDYNEDEVLLTVLSERILTSPERTDWFVRHGMPDGDDVRSLAGAFDRPGGGSALFRQNNRLFRWVHEDGRSTYFDFLRTHPGYFFVQPVRDAVDPDVAALDVTHEPYGHPRNVLPEPVEGVVFGPGALVLLALGVLAVSAFAFGLRGWTSREVVPATAVLLSVALYFVTYHGVASELGRHYMLAAVALRVSLILVGFLAVDRLLARTRSRDHDASADSAPLEPVRR
jgi:hypothetical protein